MNKLAVVTKKYMILLFDFYSRNDSFLNGDVVDNVDLMGIASRMSHQSDRRPATADRRYYKSKKSYDEALSTLAATLPLVSQRRSSLTANARASTGPRGRKGSRTGGKCK